MDRTSAVVKCSARVVARVRGDASSSSSTRIDAQSDQMGLLREGMAHLEGLLDGLREAITKRVA